MEERTRPFLLPVELQLEKADAFVVPGGKVELQAWVINRQEREDFFELAVRGVPLGWVTITPAVLQVGSGERGAAHLVIEPPAVAAASTGIYPIVVRASSQEAPDRSAEANLSLRVGAYETGNRVGVLMDSLQFNVIPGNSLAVPVMLINQGLEEDNFRLAVEGIPTSWVSTAVPVVRLKPGERREVSLMIQPPRVSQSRAGRHPFTIEVNSEIAPEQVSSVDCILTVAAFSQFASDVTPQRIEPDQPGRVRIFNQGNILSNYTIAWQSQDNALEFSPAQPPPLRIQPGEAAAIDFTAKPRSRQIFGGTTIFPFTTVVQSGEGETQTHQGEGLTHGLIPIWVLPVALVLCLTLVCIGGLLWNRGRTEVASGTLTVTAQTATVFAATQTAAFNQTAAAQIGQQDTDGDGLTNNQEQELGTDPNSPDSDNDRLLDGDEVRLGTNPLRPDTDGDGIIDGLDLDPLDPLNPRVTASAIAGQPSPTFTATIAVPTVVTPTFTVEPQPATFTPSPTFTATQEIPSPEPVVIPGNSVLAFESNREGPAEIYVFTAASGAVSRLTINPSVDTQPAWSPDGNRVAFTSNRDGNNEIYVMNGDGTAVTNLSNSPGNDQYPVWSPDGASIAFTSDRDGNQEIYGMAADGSNPVNLTNNPAQDLYPAWYRDTGLLTATERIVFATDRDGNLEVYAMNPDGSDLVNLTNSPSNDTFPSVPRGGGRVAFVTDRDGNAEVYVMNADGSAAGNRTNSAAIDTYPAFSPDGDWVAFTTNRDGNQEIYVMRADGADLGNVTRSPAEDLFADWR